MDKDTRGWKAKTVTYKGRGTLHRRGGVLSASRNYADNVPGKKTGGARSYKEKGMLSGKEKKQRPLLGEKDRHQKRSREQGG